MQDFGEILHGSLRFLRFWIYEWIVAVLGIQTTKKWEKVKCVNHQSPKRVKGSNIRSRAF